MPALNEEANIAQAINSCLAAFSQYGLKGEIVVVGDGSQDKTKDSKALRRQCCLCCCPAHRILLSANNLLFEDKEPDQEK